MRYSSSDNELKKYDQNSMKILRLMLQNFEYDTQLEKMKNKQFLL